MPDAFYFTRARLRRDVPAAALRAILAPPGESARTAAAHRLVWTLFGDRPDRARDFLWREADAGVFYLLSMREPHDARGLFELDPPKPFAPVLAAGDRLAFMLRANATVSRGTGSDRRGKPCDVVMDALYRIPQTERARARQEAIATAGTAWLGAQGAKAGFALAGVDSSPGQHGGAPCGAVTVTAYRTLRLDRPGAPARLGVLDFEGLLEVREPSRFVAAVAHGFGRAKAFGCGLMLIRRA